MNDDNDSRSSVEDDAAFSYEGSRNFQPEIANNSSILAENKNLIAYPVTRGGRGERNTNISPPWTRPQEKTEKGLGLSRVGRKKEEVSSIDNPPQPTTSPGAFSSSAPRPSAPKEIDVDDFQQSRILRHNKSLVVYPACRLQSPAPASSDTILPTNNQPSSNVIDVDNLQEGGVLQYYKNQVKYPRRFRASATTEEEEIEVPPTIDEEEIDVPAANEEETGVAAVPALGNNENDTLTVQRNADLEDGTLENQSISNQATTGQATVQSVEEQQENEPIPNQTTIGLVEAHEVAEEGPEELPQAVPYDSSEPQPFHLSRKQRRIAGLFVAGIGALVIVTIIAVIVSGKNKTQANAEEGSFPADAQLANGTLADQTLAPSWAPSKAQDFYGAILLDLLPNYTLRNLVDSSSPQSRAFAWTINDPGFLALEPWRLQQRFALATYFYATRGENWIPKAKVHWLNYSKHECRWSLTSCYEVRLWLSLNHQNDPTFSHPRIEEYLEEHCSWGREQCGEDDTYLHFAHLNVGSSGTIPPELAMLSSLKDIAIAYSDTTGSIPSEIGTLSSLELLALGLSHLTGAVPSEIGLAQNLKLVSILQEYSLSGTLFTELGQLTNLHTIAIAYTDIAGTIPTEIGNLDRLVDLFLFNMSLTGTIPEIIGQMPKMRFLSLDQNQLSGSLPLSFFNNWTLPDDAYEDRPVIYDAIPYINVPRNKDLIPTIPTALALQTTWTELHLNHIFPLIGTIPTEIGLMSSLTSLSLHGFNYLQDYNTTIPSELGQLTHLERVWLSASRLTGTIPSELFLLNAMTDLRLRWNYLTGGIQSEVGLLSNLEVLGLGANKFQGSIPSQLGLLQGLDILHLHTNNLSGSIPTELGLMTNMTEMYLYDNELTGSIQTELALLSELAFLYLGHNSFNGTIATELGFLTNLEQFNVYNNNLSGSFPLELSFVPVIDLRENPLLSGTIPDFVCILADNERLYVTQGGSYANTSLEFDCTDLLCGCDCDCM